MVSTAPRIVSAGFTAPYRHISVKFDRPVTSEQSCEQLLDADSLQQLGDAACQVRGSQLLIRPGDKMAPPSGPLTLTLAEGSAIVSRGVGSGPLAGRATGSVSVSFAEAMAVPPEFSLVGPSVVCSAADSRATYRALTLEGLGRALTYTWNVTLEADTTLTQRTTLEVWQGINEVMERDATYGTGAVSVYTINTSPLIADDFNYQVFAKAQTWAGGSRSLFRAFRVVSSGLSVAVVGPDRIAAGGLYTYRATAVLCGGEQRGFKYAWRLPGMPASALEGLDSATLRLDTAQLVWQSEARCVCGR
ncbi:uncharacterized protein LOC119098233 [Pollicipes pollicipes]|uniref:uncharacterized protein LOC119098233 n=1 Tax=Pollicipes pollicipes TaxID=41117 RepID=UPI001884E624|nr:uncharacterized protein LOC119098233 [Pollicipes pollicipes]